MAPLSDLFKPHPTGPTLPHLQDGQLGEGAAPALAPPSSPQAEDFTAYDFPREPEMAKSLGRAKPLPLQTIPLAADSWSAQQYPIPSGSVPAPVSATRIVNAGPDRRRIVIFNGGTVTVFIGPKQQSASPSSGFPLIVNSYTTLTVRGEVWASAAPGTDGVLAVMAEFDVIEP